MAATADFNRDGTLDLVTVNRDDDSVSILTGSGDGGFSAREDFPVGTRPNALAVGDLDGDDIADVVVLNRGDGDVSVLRGTGDGKLADKVDFATDWGAWALAVGDLDGDDQLDVAVAGTENLSVLLGCGDGNLEPMESYSTESYPEALSIIDMNDDDKPDLVVTGWKGILSVFPGNGDGTLAEPVESAIPFGSNSAVVGDLDGAGGPDVALIDSWEPELEVLLSAGDGVVSAVGSYPVGEQPMSDSPYSYPSDITNSQASLALSDLNADSRLDLVVANPGSASVSVFFGGDRGRLSYQADYWTGGSPLGVVASDLNNDQNLDLAVTKFDVDSVSVLLGRGDGSFEVCN